MMIKPLGRFSIENDEDFDNIEKIGKALSSKLRIKMLQQIHLSPLTVTDLAKLNKITTSTVIFHTTILEEAKLIQMKYKPGKKGKTQVFFIGHLKLEIDYTTYKDIKEKKHIQSIPIGQFTNANFDEYVRFATTKQMYRIEKNDAFNPLMRNAELIWTGGGKIEYSFSNQFAFDNLIRELNISFEICSETFGHLNDWKSDVTFAINDIELTTYTCPGDYGGKRGKLNPEWWASSYTQYGDLITISINCDGVFLNNQLVNKKITLNDLKLTDYNRILFSLYNKKNAEYYGGFNLFGKAFGNYEQDILLTVIYDEKI